MRISDRSSDVFSSDLGLRFIGGQLLVGAEQPRRQFDVPLGDELQLFVRHALGVRGLLERLEQRVLGEGLEVDPFDRLALGVLGRLELVRSEEHTSELQSLMRISYAVFCLKKKKQTTMNYLTANV